MSSETRAAGTVGFDDLEKSRILMHEYNNLRTQVTHRTNNAFQLISLAGAIVVWLLSRAAETMTEGKPVWTDWPFGVCIVIALVSLGIGARYILRDVARSKVRLTAIQERVNRMAGEAGLLQGANP